MNSPADCLFCKVAARKIPSTIVYETDAVLGFKDVNPQAPVHLLFVPKKHVAGLHEIRSPEDDTLTLLILAANQMAHEYQIQDSGFRLVINCNKDGGQTIDHLHLHLLGGRKMIWPPG